MSLRDLDIPGVLDTSNSSLSRDFFIPALTHSVRYDRGVGFFTSGWIRSNSQGLIPFIQNGGVARWITSPLLNKEDYDALALGVSARKDKKVFGAIENEIENLIHYLDHDLLLTLAWMVADRRLIFKIALPTEKLSGGDFHDKFGIFTDESGDQVSFIGSYNDTAKGELNYESIKIFKSWQPDLSHFVESDSLRFKNLWNGMDPNLRIFSLPKALKEKILIYRDLGERPYELAPVVSVPVTSRKGFPELRHYQEEAVEEWINCDYRGILEMATGTGKTITSLFCMRSFFEEEPYGIAIILCPYIHLVTQWKEDVDRFNIETVLGFGPRQTWEKTLETKLQELALAKRLKVESHKKLAIICTYATFFSDNFQKHLSRIALPLMLLADEAHNVGTQTSLQQLPTKARYRLGLSATPERFGDEEGTKGLYDYFGGVIYRLDLHQAIFDLQVLSHYTYQIHQVQLSDDEFKEYRDLTREIAKLIGGEQTPAASSQLDVLLVKRSNVLNTARAKISRLRELLKEIPNIKKTLFYCAPKQLPKVNRLLARDLGIISHQITYREDKAERSQIMKDFERGYYQALTAIKCLDEGVDIPAIESAYILASSANPREFIQRRGRILRKAEGKEKAHIIDVMTTPPDSRHFSEAEYRLERSILAKELRRIRYFASCADNRNEALLAVYSLASQYNLQHVLLGDNS